ncbi:MAG: PilZ domain-containing protein [Thermodesulfobacteriota bacterium]|jgi:hypothetical protein
MENRRKIIRYTTQVKAHYLFKGGKEWGECTITDISHEGMQITFQNSEKIKLASTIYLRVFFSVLGRPTKMKGALKWFEKKRDDFVSGIELYHIKRDKEIN